MPPFSQQPNIKQRTSKIKDMTKQISDLGFPQMKEILIPIKHNSYIYIYIYIFKIEHIKGLLSVIH